MRLKNSTLILLVLMLSVSSILFVEDVNPSISLSGEICSSSSIFDCGIVKSSDYSNIKNIPISGFGFCVSIVFLLTYLLFPSAFSSLIIIQFFNALGALSLFLYSLFELQTLCPFCLVYQLSSILLFIEQLYIKQYRIKFKYLFSLGLLLLAMFLSLFLLFNREKQSSHEYFNDKEKKIIKVFNKRLNMGNPLVKEDFWLIKNKRTFLDSAIQISIFSDFQCPACKKLSIQLKPLIDKYQKDINLQYINYPLDPKCNLRVLTPLHPEACLMSKIFICAKDKREVYDKLFESQGLWTEASLLDYAKRIDVDKCLNYPSTKGEIEKHLNEARKHNIQATPTMIINGRKIEGIISNDLLEPIFKYLKYKKDK